MHWEPAIESVVGLSNLAEAQQSSGGEDFAWYLEHVPGAMGRLGVWDGVSARCDLHRPEFSLDERALEGLTHDRRNGGPLVARRKAHGNGHEEQRRGAC